MDAFFTDLGRSVLERWKRENFSLDRFPGIACAALNERPPARHVDLAAFMRQFLLDDEQPAQSDSDFGQPELVVYKHPRFYIQVLFWLDGTTAIHQHEFSGAFHVAHGSSIHADYAFVNPKSVTPYFRIGDVRMKEIELLEVGRTVPIVSGQQSIHSLFHLDTPSVTVVIRTQHDPGTGPQFNYLPPHVAVDPTAGDALMLRRKQLLDVLEQTDLDEYANVVMAMLAELDLERGFHVLQYSMEPLQQLGLWTPALAAFEKRHSRLAKGVAATLEDEVRRETIKGLRGTVTEPEHRFFLALLMNAPTCADLLSLVAQRYPKEKPADVVMRWVGELQEVTEYGISVLDAAFAETSNIDVDQQPALFMATLQHCMSGSKKLPKALSGLSKADLKELKAVIAESSLRVLAV